MELIKRCLDFVLSKLIIFLFSMLLICIIWQVLARWMGVNSTFTDEGARFIFIWVGLFGASLAHGQKRHLAIDLLTSRLSGRRKVWSDRLIHCLVIVFSVSVMVMGGYMAMLNTQGQVSSAMHIPMWIIYLAIPLNGLAITFYSLNDLLQDLKAPQLQGA
ncbi:TRAP transporter small permease [Deefgea piscis]|uniref:TRAP transporter small permease protein n=1 Tax=Deefgea piscis TaxID=2739061 RepID=A0A6M8STB8_9NEIS|nr:TRAP transporter small permease [Deefgea piscis]QKJ67941.1 TRAP transporter small permease [Deefgea piscis]